MFLRRFHTFRTLLKEKPKNLKSKKHSSQQWITRQLADPYVEKAKRENYRCRSAFKLLEINDKYKILEPGMIVVDCGAAPGSWTQAATRLVNSNQSQPDEQVGKVFAIDKLPIHPIDGAICFGNMDFTTEEAHDMLVQSLDRKFADVVMSDMAPNASGIKDLDHENIIKLAYNVLEFAFQVTTYEGVLLVKVWDGAESKQLEADIAKFFKSVKIVRPGATRDESSEKFILARGFRGVSVKAKS